MPISRRAFLARSSQLSISAALASLTTRQASAHSRSCLRVDSMEFSSPEPNVTTDFPILYFHGTGSAMLEPGLADPSSLAGARLIAFNREGIGCSTFIRFRCLQEWARHFQFCTLPILERRHGFESQPFGIIGESGGTAYALACLERMPDRITRVACMAGGLAGAPGIDVGVLDRPRRFAKRFPSVASTMLTLFAPRDADSEDVVRVTRRKRLSLADINYVQENGKFLADIADQVFRQNARGFVQDAALIVPPWGINWPTVYGKVSIWHGTEDRIVTAQAAELLATHCNAPLTTIPGEGHISIIPAVMADAVQYVLSAIQPV